MRITFYILIITLTFQSIFAQNPNTNTKLNKGSFEFKAGYTNFDKDFDGGYFTAGYNYNFNEYLVGQVNASFDFGKNSKDDGMGEDSYKAGMAIIGIKGELPLFNRHKIRVGPEVGIMLLSLDRADITDDPLLFPVVYGFSVSYLFEINEGMEIGLSFSQQYMTNLDFTNQKFGVVFVLN